MPGSFAVSLTSQNARLAGKIKPKRFGIYSHFAHSKNIIYEAKLSVKKQLA